MTIATKRPAIRLMAVAFAFALTSGSHADSDAAIDFHEGTFRSGAHRLAVDDRGTLHLLAGDGSLIDGIHLAGNHDGALWRADRMGQVAVTRSEEGLRVESIHPAGQISYVLTVTPADGDLVLRAERQGGLPTEESQDYLRLALPIAYFRGAQFYCERITLPYDDRTFEEPMIIDGFREFHAHISNDTFNFMLNTEEPVMRIEDPWQERLGIYRLDVPLPAGEEAAIEVRLTFPASAGDLLEPAIRFPSVGYRLDGPKRAIVEWHDNVERPDATIQVLSVDGSVALEGQLGDTVTFMGKNYAEFDFTSLSERGVYRFSWSGGESDFFVVRDSVIVDSLWTPTLDRFLPWQMAHAEVDFGAALPPKRAAFMDDGVRAPADVPSVGGFISHGQEGSLYEAGEAITANIGGWFDGGVTHQNVPAHAYTVWMLSLANEQFQIDRDSATYNQQEQKYSLQQGDQIPDVLSQIEWGVWWLLQMQEPTGRVYTGVVSRPDRDTVMFIPERTTDGEAGTEDERHVYVDYHPHVQLAQVIGLSVSSRQLRESNPALSRRALEAARGAFDYFVQQPEVYRPTVNFPYTADHPAVMAGRDSMLLAAAAEIYIATQDAQYLEVLEAMKGTLEQIPLTDPAPRWSRDSGFWYAAPSLARLHFFLADGELREAVEGYLERAAHAKKEYLAQRPWPFSPQDIGTRGVNSAAIAQVVDVYWIAQVKPDLISLEDALPAFEWVVGLHPLSGLTFVSGVGYEAPSHLYNANIHGRVRNLQATVPGAFMPGIGRLQGNTILTYADLPLKGQHHDARTADQAAWIFAVHALKDAGF